jgi:hypothetical protein
MLKEWKNRDGITFKAGQLVTAYFDGIFEIVGFTEEENRFKDSMVSEPTVTVVHIKQRYDKLGNERIGKQVKSCAADFCVDVKYYVRIAVTEMQNDIERLQKILVGYEQET